MVQRKDSSLIPSGRYCYRFVKLAPGEVVPPAGPEMGRAQRECAAHGDTHKEVLCPYFEYSTYRTVRCLYLGQEVLQLFDSPEDVAPQMVARFGTPEAAQAFEADSLLGDSIKVCGVGLEPDQFEGEDDEDRPALNEVDRVGQPVYRHQRHLMPGQWVEHPKWGRGRVTDVRFPFDGPALVLVNFGSVGEQRLLRDEALLRRVPSPGGAAAAPVPPPDVDEPPWLALTGLLGPGSGPTLAWRRAQHRGPRGVSRAVQAAWPPFKALGGVLGDVLAQWARDAYRDKALGAVLWAAAVPAREALVADVWPQGVACRWLEITDGRLFNTYDGTSERSIRRLHGEIKRRVQALRQVAVVNGNWWPAPLRVQLLLADAGRRVGLRLCFAHGYQPDFRPWLARWLPQAMPLPLPRRTKPAPFTQGLKLKPGDWVEDFLFGRGLTVDVVRKDWGFLGRVDYGLHGVKDSALDVALLRHVPALSADEEAAWRLPQAAPWEGVSQAVCLPDNAPQGEGRLRRVRPAPPPYKALRGLMADMLATKRWRDSLVYESVREVAEPVWPHDADGEPASGSWPGDDDAQGWALDVLNLPDALTSKETRVFLRDLLHRWLRRLETLQRKAVANGRWWPGPDALEVLLSSDGLLGVRVLFPPGFSPQGETWFVYWHPNARTRRAYPIQTHFPEIARLLADRARQLAQATPTSSEYAAPSAAPPAAPPAEPPAELPAVKPPVDLPSLPGCVWLLQTHVAGMAYYQAEQAMDSLQAGSPLQLRREPGNVYDALAIEVLTEAGLKLGYVPQNRNPVLARLMDAGQALRAQVLSVGTFPSDPKPWQTSLPEVRLRIDWRPAEATPIGMGA